MGWGAEGPAPVPERNCVILEAPHTSIWDFVIGYLYYRSRGGHLRVMIKKEAFFFPFGNLLKSMGGLPIDRANPQAVLRSIIREMESSSDKPFHLVICPEGTRRKVHKWKTGYHVIATETGIPVYLSFVDWGHKKVGIHCKFTLTGSPREDTDAIQKVYAGMNLVAKHPDGYVTE